MTMDFRALLDLAQSPALGWAQFWVCICVALGTVWQMAHDGRFAVASIGGVTARVGLIVRLTFALGGIGDSYVHAPNPLILGAFSGTLIIQAVLFARWVRLGRPDFL